MYALINTMSKLDNYAGTIISLHRTRDAADEADGRLQRAVRKANGQGSYLPTCVRCISRRARKGAMLHEADCE